MTSTDDRLRQYYDEAARRQTRHRKGPLRVGLHERFVAMLNAERRRSVIDIGSGPGRDTIEFPTAIGNTGSRSRASREGFPPRARSRR